jgi:hypothetical protein
VHYRKRDSRLLGEAMERLINARQPRMPARVGRTDLCLCTTTALHHHSWRKAKQKRRRGGDRQRIAKVVQIPNCTELATSGGVLRQLAARKKRLEPQMTTVSRYDAYAR